MINESNKDVLRAFPVLKEIPEYEFDTWYNKYMTPQELVIAVYDTEYGDRNDYLKLNRSIIYTNRGIGYTLPYNYMWQVTHDKNNIIINIVERKVYEKSDDGDMSLIFPTAKLYSIVGYNEYDVLNRLAEYDDIGICDEFLEEYYEKLIELGYETPTLFFNIIYTIRPDSDPRNKLRKLCAYAKYSIDDFIIRDSKKIPDMIAEEQAKNNESPMNISNNYTVIIPNANPNDVSIDSLQFTQETPEKNPNESVVSLHQTNNDPRKLENNCGEHYISMFDSMANVLSKYICRSTPTNITPLPNVGPNDIIDEVPIPNANPNDVSIAPLPFTQETPEKNPNGSVVSLHQMNNNLRKLEGHCCEHHSSILDLISETVRKNGFGVNIVPAQYQEGLFTVFVLDQSGMPLFNRSFMIDIQGATLDPRPKWYPAIETEENRGVIEFIYPAYGLTNKKGDYIGEKDISSFINLRYAQEGNSYKRLYTDEEMSVFTWFMYRSLLCLNMHVGDKINIFKKILKILNNPAVKKAITDVQDMPLFNIREANEDKFVIVSEKSKGSLHKGVIEIIYDENEKNRVCMNIL